jgi:hypothetical protein
LADQVRSTHQPDISTASGDFSREVTCQGTSRKSQILKLKIHPDLRVEVLKSSDLALPNYHFTGWELKNFISKNFKGCLQEYFDQFKFQKVSQVLDVEHSTLISRPIEDVSGFYIKIINPNKGRFFVPDGRSERVNCAVLNRTNLRKYNCVGRCADEALNECAKKTCRDLNFNSNHKLYSEVSPGEFSEASIGFLEHPLFHLEKWSTLFPGFEVYVNTSWFSIADFGPHDTPCSHMYGTTVSEGTLVAGPQSETQEALSLFAVHRSGEVKFVPPNGKWDPSDPIISAFSGMLVMKDFDKIEPFQKITVPGAVTGRTAFAFDAEKNLIVFTATNGFNVSKLTQFLSQNLDAKDILVVDGGGSSRMILNDPRARRSYSNQTRDWQGSRPVPSILAIGADEVVVDDSMIDSEKLLKSAF